MGRICSARAPAHVFVSIPRTSSGPSSPKQESVAGCVGRNLCAQKNRDANPNRYGRTDETRKLFCGMNIYPIEALPPWRSIVDYAERELSMPTSCQPHQIVWEVQIPPGVTPYLSPFANADQPLSQSSPSTLVVEDALVAAAGQPFPATPSARARAPRRLPSLAGVAAAGSPSLPCFD